MKQKASPSRRDDGNTRLLVSHAAQRLPALVDRPVRVRDGYSLRKLTQHFVLGYFRQVPAGLIFSNHQRTCTIQIASPYVDAYGQLPDEVGSASCRASVQSDFGVFCAFAKVSSPLGCEPERF